MRGEISNFKAHTSGHFYFSLKDSKSQIAAVMFRGHNARLRFKPNDGLEVLVRGKIAVYEPRGNYQIVCDTMEPVGAGALQKAFEQLKVKLKQEGLFDPAKKKPIPPFPKHVAIVTSPTGAAIRDMINVLSRRAKNVRVTVIPTIVQGEAAAPQIVAAFKKASLLQDVDVIIVGRGGGSIEDLWAFNDEMLARTIANSQIPVISAVGHEIDFTIADFVADLRAPTPSAAAELVAKSSGEIENKLKGLDRLLALSMDKMMRGLFDRCLGLSRRLVDPQKKLQDLALRNDDLMNRLEFALSRRFQGLRHRVEILNQKLGRPDQKLIQKRQRMMMLDLRLEQNQRKLLERRKLKIERLMAMLDGLSPLRVVDRGYSIVTLKDSVVKDSGQVSIGDELKIRLAHGELKASVTDVIKPKET